MHLVYELMPAGNMETAEFKKYHIDHAVLPKVRAAFPRAIIWCGGFSSRENAQAALDTGLVDLIASGKPYIANTDVVERLQHGWLSAEAIDQLIAPDVAKWVTQTSLHIRAVALHAAQPDCGRGPIRLDCWQARQTSHPDTIVPLAPIFDTHNSNRHTDIREVR